MQSPNRMWAIGLTVVVVGLLSALLYVNSRSGAKPAGGSGAGKPSEGPLIFYCAAGIKPPVNAVVAAFTAETGIPIRLQYAGSGTLLSNLQIARLGDLYLAGDSSFIDMAREKELVEEALPLATLRPVIAVPADNPKGIETVEDLLGADLRLGLGNPGAASIGKQTRKALEVAGLWEKVEAAARARGVFKPTVNEVANDIKIGTVDVGIIWDATARQYPELKIVCPLSADPAFVMHVTVGVLSCSKRATDALRLARYLSAPSKGGRVFQKSGYEPIRGDPWAETPEILLLSGGVNRSAIEDTLRAFEAREGCRVTRVYNGCGILVAQIKAGERPDAYFACDVSFMDEVQDLFLDSTDLSETDIIIAVGKGNPKGIGGLADLAAEGCKLGVANPKQSALGALTSRLLKDAGLLEGVMANNKSQTPTADLLVNQLRTGTLDAVIVYEANVARVLEHLDIVRISHPDAKAVQPFAVSQETTFPLLTLRLLRALCSKRSRRRYMGSGFRLLTTPPNGQSE